MIGKLLTAFLNLLLTIVMSVIQLICLPLNALFDNVFPDFSEKLSLISQGITVAFNNLSWAANMMPPLVRTTILFILTVELSMFAIMRSSHLTSKVWKLLQKLKFW